MDVINHICELYDVDGDVKQIWYDIISKKDGDHTFTCDGNMMDGISQYEEINLNNMIQILIINNDHHKTNNKIIISNRDSYLDNKRYKIYTFNNDLILRIEESILYYFTYVIMNIFLYQHSNVDMSVLFKNYYALSYIDIDVGVSLRLAYENKLEFEGNGINMSVLVEDNKIIYWSVNHERQDINDEALMLHYYFRIICDNYICHVKSARF